MTPPVPASRLLLLVLLLGASFPASAEDVGTAAAAVPVPKPDPRSAAQKLQDQIKEACEAPAVEIRLLDPAAKGPVQDGAQPPPNVKREKEATSVADRLGAGVESEEDQTGQTLTRKRGKTTKAKCQTDVGRVAQLYPGRFSVQPTTEERVEKVKAVRESLFGKRLTANASDAAAFNALVDGGEVSPTSAQLGIWSPGLAAPADNRPGRPTLQAYRGPLTNPTPAPPNYQPATFSELVTGYAHQAKETVVSGLNQASEWVSGVARSVRNSFYTGIEMIQGYGYKFIHAGRSSNWGTKPLVNGLRTIAAYMRGTGKAETDLAVGDLSSVNGGQLGGHASHQTGRDVDIGFYMTDAGTGKPVDTLNFVSFTGGKDGLTGSNGGRAVRFDAQRNWMLIQAILANPDPEFKPTYIFISNHLRAAVLAAGAASPERDRAAALMRFWPGHDNHLHLRIQ